MTDRLQALDAAEQFRRQEKQQEVDDECNQLVSQEAADQRHNDIQSSIAALNIFKEVKSGMIVSLDPATRYVAAEGSCAALLASESGSEADMSGELVALEHDPELMWLYKQLGVEVSSVIDAQVSYTCCKVLSSESEFLSSVLSSDLSEVALSIVHQYLLR